MSKLAMSRVPTRGLSTDPRPLTKMRRPPALTGKGLGIQPAFGRDEDNSAAEPDDCPHFSGGRPLSMLQGVRVTRRRECFRRSSPLPASRPRLAPVTEAALPGLPP